MSTLLATILILAVALWALPVGIALMLVAGVAVIAGVATAELRRHAPPRIAMPAGIGR